MDEIPLGRPVVVMLVLVGGAIYPIRILTIAFCVAVTFGYSWVIAKMVKKA
jgi:hypothetical protein